MGSGGVSAVVNVIDASRSGSARSRPGGVGDVDRDAGDGGETGVLGHLAAPAPDDRGSHGPREAGDHDLQGSGNGAQVVAAVPTIRHEHTSAGEGGTHPSAKQLVLVNFGYLRLEDLIAQAPDMRRPATTGVSHTLGAICTSPSLSTAQIDMTVILASPPPSPCQDAPKELSGHSLNQPSQPTLPPPSHRKAWSISSCKRRPYAQQERTTCRRTLTSHTKMNR